MANKGWRTYRVVVEVPVMGACTEHAVVSAVRESISIDLPRLDVAYMGKVKVKSLDRVWRAQASALRGKGRKGT
jgi:hypothetical protein